MRIDPRRIAALLGLLAVLSVTGLAIVLVTWARSETAQIETSFERYQQARRRIDVESLVACTGPETRDWMGLVLRTARSGGREAVLSKTPLQAATVLEFRHLYSARQLDAMSVDDAVRSYIGRWERDATIYELTDVRTKGTVASARLWLRDNSGSTRVLAGEGQLFARGANGWLFNWHIPLERSMHPAKQFGREELAVLIERSCSAAWGEPFDARLWDGPRPGAAVDD